MEVVKIESHPKGGTIVTIQRVARYSKDEIEKQHPGKKWYEITEEQQTYLKTEEYLNEDYSWYTWPGIKTVGLSMKIALREALEEHQLQQKYRPPKKYNPKPTGNPNRCMFCHTDLSGMAANCLKCGGAMHLKCADENEDKCITPGCGAS